MSSIITSAKPTEAVAEKAITARPSRTPWRTRREGVVVGVADAAGVATLAVARGAGLGGTVVATVVADTAGIDLDPLLGDARVLLLVTGW